jgi:pimeloyl-ACP methyl ester carboxylesterase
VNAGIQNSASNTVKLAWTGQIEEAYLVLSVAGSEAGHSVYINGQLVGQTPIQPNGQPCDTYFLGEIPISADILINGENVITLTNDANPNDSWTAASLYLEIQGILSGPPAASLESSPESGLGAQAVIDSVPLTSSYELARGQLLTHIMYYQIPDNYTGNTPVPLLIGIHGRGGSGMGPMNDLGSEANSRGWLLASPEMHGNFHTNHGKYALAWPGAQYDIIDTIEWMVDHYNVDKSRIYIAGGSMGGQTTAMTAAKFPDIFAAATPWKPLTDLTDWYYDLEDLGGQSFNLKKIREETGANDNPPETEPDEAPFEYQRRSPMEIPRNSRLMPIKMWHDIDDTRVEIYHSRDLKNAINAGSPPIPVILDEILSGEYDCPDDPTYQHCYTPDMDDLFDFLYNYTRNNTPPVHLNIRTDESKSYYWLKITQSGGEHWTAVSATYTPASKTVNAVITDTNQLTLGFNLGPTPITGLAEIFQAGLGLGETTFLVKVQNQTPYTKSYTTGQYFTVALQNTGTYTLTISPYSAPGSGPGTTNTYLPVLIKQ